MPSIMKQGFVALSASLAMFAGLSTGPAVAQEKPAFSFGLWGDMPYAKAKDQPKVAALIEDMNSADIAFSIYDGDIKDGSSKCTDDIYQGAITMFNSLVKPVVYVPGDNEWTDCHRTNNGGYDNLERLAYLRKVMFAKSESFGKETMALEHQAMPGEKFSENTRFSKDGVMFVGLNIPGSNNNKVNDDEKCTKKSARTKEQCALDNAEFEERNKANNEWLVASMDKARAAGDKGVMVVIQADPGFDMPETEEEDESRRADYDGYASFLDTLTEQTKQFAGQVVLVHGDTHFFKIDKSLIDATHTLANFTRVQTFGSPSIHWIKVDVDPASRNVFSFHPMIVDANSKVGLAN